MMLVSCLCILCGRVCLVPKIITITFFDEVFNPFRSRFPPSALNISRAKFASFNYTNNFTVTLDCNKTSELWSFLIPLGWCAWWRASNSNGNNHHTNLFPHGVQRDFVEQILSPEQVITLQEEPRMGGSRNEPPTAAIRSTIISSPAPRSVDPRRPTSECALVLLSKLYRYRWWSFKIRLPSQPLRSKNGNVSAT